MIGKEMVVIVAEWKTPKPESKAHGPSLFASTFRTSGPDVFDLRLNSHSRLNLIQALIQAIHAGADEALMLRPARLRGLQLDQLLHRAPRRAVDVDWRVFVQGDHAEESDRTWTAAGGVTRECDFTLAQVYSADVRDRDAGWRHAGDQGGQTHDRRRKTRRADGAGW